MISWFSLLLLQLLRHLFYRHLKLHRQRYILIVWRLMLVMVVFFIAFRWIHLSTPLIRLFLLVLILLLMPTLHVLPVWFALSLLRFRLPSRLPMMFSLWMVAMMVVIIPFSFFNDTATTEIYTLSLHDALPISAAPRASRASRAFSESPAPFKAS